MEGVALSALLVALTLGTFLEAPWSAGGLGRRRAGIRGLDCGVRRVAGPAAGEPHVSLGRAARRDLTVSERTSETPGRVRLRCLSGAPGVGALSVAAPHPIPTRLLGSVSLKGVCEHYVRSFMMLILRPIGG